MNKVGLLIGGPVLALAVAWNSARAEPMNPPGTRDFTVQLTETGKPGGTPVKDIFRREPGDLKCEHCPPMTLAAACAGALEYWSPADDAEFSAGGRLDEAAKVGQVLARDRLAKRIEANPQAVALSPVEQTRLVRLLSRILAGVTFEQAVAIVSPNETVPELK